MTEPSTDPPRRSLRAHKEIDYLGKNVYAADESEDVIPIPNGKGMKLSSLASWKTARSDDLSLIHRLVFNRAGTQNERKKNLSEFHGLDPSVATMNRITERISAAPKTDIQKSLKVCGLSVTGPVKELATRLAEFLFDPKGTVASEADTQSLRSQSARGRRGRTASAKSISDTSDEKGSKKRGRSVSTASRSGKKTKEQAKEDKKKDASEKEPATSAKRGARGRAASTKAVIPSDQEITSWVVGHLQEKSEEEIASCKIKELRESAESHFSLSSGALNIKKDVLMKAVAHCLPKSDESLGSHPLSAELSTEPSIAHPEDSCNNLVAQDSREASPSRAQGGSESQAGSKSPSQSRSVLTPGQQQEILRTAHGATDDIRQVIESMLHQQGSQQLTPEPSVAQPEGSFFVPDPNRSVAQSHQATPEPSVAADPDYGRVATSVMPHRTASESNIVLNGAVSSSPVQITPEPSVTISESIPFPHHGSREMSLSRSESNTM